MTREDRELRQGRSKDQHDQNYKVLEFMYSIGLISFVIYLVLRPWL